MANSAGCVVPVWLSSCSSSPQMMFLNCGSRWASTSSNAVRNVSNRAYSSRPMPRRCEPCPVNRNAVVPALRATPFATSTPSTNNALCANCARVVAAENARSS